MNKILLIVFLFPFFGFAQVDLVQWNGSTDLIPTILNDNIVASNVTGAGITGPTPSNDGIIGSGWPTGNTIDTGKYFQITLNPILDGSVVLNEINFTYKGSYNSFQVRYSKSADFSNPTILTTVTNANPYNTPTNVSLTNPITVNSGEKIYIRFYAYNGSGEWKLMNNNLLKLRGTITAPSRMIGDYIIGNASGSSFPTISAAVKALMSVGARGDVRFLLDNALYNTSTNESFPIVISPYTGNDLYKVTFKPNTGKTVTIAASNNTINNNNNTVKAVFKLNGVDKVIFDGSNSENGTTKNLTLDNTNTSNNNRAVIWIASENSSNGSNNNEIKNIILKQYSKGQEDYSIGIFGGGTSDVSSVAEAANTNTTVTNVEFNKVGQAIYVNGNTSLLSSNWYIRANTIGNTSSDNTTKPYVAVNFMNVKDYEVSNNIIDGLVRDASQNTSSTHAAVYVDGNSNGSIFNNKIANLSNLQGDGAPDSRGIYINSSNNLVYNNFIRNITSSASYSKASGIYIHSGSGNKIYYNTIVMNNNSNLSSCLYINGGSALDIINNIFYNSQTTGTQYAVYSNVGNTAFTRINYNDYYSATIGFLSGARTTLANWRTATAQDVNSDNKLPAFVSATDLHLQNVAANSFLKTGMPISILTDIDGETRAIGTVSSNQPYIGADEICSLPAAAGTITGAARVCQGQSGVEYAVPAISNATSYNWSYSGTGVTLTNATTRTPTITFASNATSGNLTVKGVNSCGNGTISANYSIIINTTPVITSNKVNETCPTSNDGSISPVLSGGLTNVRYIKLTQKYAAYQQVAEIQAFEVFTETNVALASNGATVLATSTYPGGYQASRAIDNNLGSFWHSNSTNTGENIRVDLSSGKNIDYLRIHNRANGYWDRGQNMLLELFDASNNLVYSKTVNLWEGVNGPHYVEVNVLDVSWADGATTLNRTGLDSGSYTLNYSDAVGCAASSPINIGSVNTAPVAPTAAAQSLCGSGTVGSLVGAAPSGSVVEWFSASSGGSALAAGTVLSSTTYYAQSRNTTTGCLSTTRTAVVVTINSLPSAPTVGNITQPTCAVPTASVELSGLPSSGNWTINPGNYTGTGSVTTISGLIAGTYNFTVSNEKCTSPASENVAIVDPVVNNTWTGTWSNGTPTINQRIIFNANYSSPSDLEACSCRVNDVAVTFNSGHTLKIVNGVNVQDGGSLTFENTASLVQIEDAAVNSGKINYKRHTNYVKRYDFTYWSSPVKGQKMKALSPNTLFDKYYRYNPDAGWEISYSGVDTMKEGEGYIIRAPQSFSITNAAIDTNPMFVGEPNNGEIRKTITGGKVYLLGNPYPSAIDADLFLNLNSTVLAGTLYFWTHNSPPRTGVPGGDAMYSYTTNDYATYNRTGGVGTAAITGGEPPTRNIGAGQGFFAPASATGGELIFKNEIRLLDNEVIDNSQFFKLSNSSKESKLAIATIEKNRLWLNLTNAEGAFKQTLIGYITGATNDYESSFDGITYDGNQYVDFYSINNAVNLSIQGRSLPFEKKDSVALGYKSTIKGDFKISIDHTDGVLSSQDIFLEDKDLKVLHDLKKSAYTFSVDKGVFNNRFVLRYVDKNEVEVIVPETPDEVLIQGVIVSVHERKITITADAALDKVVVYDMTGRKIFQKNNVNDSVFVVPYLLSSRQVLAVDIELLDGSKFSRKIVY